MAQLGRRGCLKHSLLKVQILPPAFELYQSVVGRAYPVATAPGTVPADVAQLGRRAGLRSQLLEVRLLPSACARLAEWVEAQGCKPCQIGSIPMACLIIRRGGETGKHTVLKPPHSLRVRFPPSAFDAGEQVFGWVS